MSTFIHPTAIVSENAILGKDIHIGPFAVIEDKVEIGNRCVIAAQSVIKSGTILGDNNEIAEGAVIGGKPQHTRCDRRFGGLKIGEGNRIRENVTIHCALHDGAITSIGNHNLIMVNAHIAHDCVVGNHTIIVNNAMLAGHVVVEDRAYISGAVGIHQFCRVGQYAMIGGQAHIVQDVPPYVTVDGATSQVVGLNRVGLRRNGFSDEQLQQLKEAYRLIYRSGLTWSEVLVELRSRYHTGPADAFAKFLAHGKRGFIPERKLPRGATLRLPSVATSEDLKSDLRKAG